MEANKCKDAAKEQYEKPAITEEKIFEQEALACAVNYHSTPGGTIDCQKVPTTPGTWRS